MAVYDASGKGADEEGFDEATAGQWDAKKMAAFGKPIGGGGPNTPPLTGTKNDFLGPVPVGGPITDPMAFTPPPVGGGALPVPSPGPPVGAMAAPASATLNAGAGMLGQGYDRGPNAAGPQNVKAATDAQNKLPVAPVGAASMFAGGQPQSSLISAENPVGAGTSAPPPMAPPQTVGSTGIPVPAAGQASTQSTYSGGHEVQYGAGGYAANAQNLANALGGSSTYIDAAQQIAKLPKDQQDAVKAAFLAQGGDPKHMEMVWDANVGSNIQRNTLNDGMQASGQRGAVNAQGKFVVMNPATGEYEEPKKDAQGNYIKQAGPLFNEGAEGEFAQTNTAGEALNPADVLRNRLAGRQDTANPNAARDKILADNEAAAKKLAAQGGTPAGAAAGNKPPPLPPMPVGTASPKVPPASTPPSSAPPSGGLPAGFPSTPIHGTGAAGPQAGAPAGMPGPQPVGGSGVTGPTGNTPINPANALTSARLQVGPLADRYKIAQERFDSEAKRTDPIYQAALRDANRSAAVGGAIGSGALNTSTGNLASNRLNELDSLRSNFLNSALEGSIGDEFAKTGIDQQQQGFQAGRQDTAFNQSTVLKQLEEYLKQGQFNRDDRTLQAGNTGDPSGLLATLSQIFGSQASASGNAAAQGFQNAGANSGNTSGLPDWLLQLLQQGGGGGYGGGGSGTPVYGGAGVPS